MTTLLTRRKNKRSLPSDCFFPTEKRQAKTSKVSAFVPTFSFPTPAPPKKEKEPIFEDASVEDMANLRLDDNPSADEPKPDRPPIVRDLDPGEEIPTSPPASSSPFSAVLPTFATTADGKNFHLRGTPSRLPPSLKLADGIAAKLPGTGPFGGFERLTGGSSPNDRDRAPKAPRAGCACGACRACLAREVTELRMLLQATKQDLTKTTDRLHLAERRMMLAEKRLLSGGPLGCDVSPPWPYAPDLRRTKPLLPPIVAMLADTPHVAPSSSGMSVDEDEQMEPPQPKPPQPNVQGSIRKVWEQASKFFSKMSFNWLGKQYKLNVLNNFVLGNGVCIYAVELKGPDDSREKNTGSSNPLMFDQVPGMA